MSTKGGAHLRSVSKSCEKWSQPSSSPSSSGVLTVVLSMKSDNLVTMTVGMFISLHNGFMVGTTASKVIRPVSPESLNTKFSSSDVYRGFTLTKIAPAIRIDQ